MKFEVSDVKQGFDIEPDESKIYRYVTVCCGCPRYYRRYKGNTENSKGRFASEDIRVFVCRDCKKPSYGLYDITDNVFRIPKSVPIATGKRIQPE